jgi:hypothetical protein
MTPAKFNIMKTKSVSRLTRIGSRAGGVLSVLGGLLLATGHSTAQVILNGTPQIFAGTATGSSVPGVNGSYFDNITDYNNLTLDGATYTVPDGRSFAGSKGLLLQTPTVNAPLYAGEVSGFGMFSGVSGDRFSTAFSGTFTPQATGTHWFEWHNDDRGAMYIDLNADGTFQSTDRVGNNDWNSNASVELTAGVSYNYIYTVIPQDFIIEGEKAGWC